MASPLGGASAMIHGKVYRRAAMCQQSPALFFGKNMLFLCLIWAIVSHSSGLLSHVQQYEVVLPQRRARSLQDSQLCPDTVQYDLTIEGRNHTVHLEKNRNLIGESYTETHYSEDGKRVTASPNKEHCFYHGHVQGEAGSSVSVGLCSGISGVLRVQQQVYLIEPLGQTVDEEHAVYRREHLKVPRQASSDLTLLFDRDQNQDQEQDQSPQPEGLFKSRSWKTKSLPGPQKFVELFIVVDSTEYKRYGKNTRSRILAVVNHIDQLYRTVNIRIILVGLEIWSHRDYIDVVENPDTTLDNLMVWRHADLLKRTKHDNVQLVTGKDLENDTVGLANKFAMCTGNSGGVNRDHHINPLGLASTIAHEMGHNFGLSHDAPGCVCGPAYSSSNCVMTEKLNTGGLAYPDFFSDCSIQQLTQFMERAQPSCLNAPGQVEAIPVGPLCGNALLDPGEECDCGTAEECNNRCCDASTCRLTEGSQCAHGECCESCQLKESGSICRSSAGGCDLPEYCSGDSTKCPEDSFEMNGKPCYNQQPGYCYNGQCPTRAQHCWRLFGEGAKEGPDLCFNLNKQGVEGANCGRDGHNFYRCSSQNQMCGTMFCVGGKESITGKHGASRLLGIECRLALELDKTRNMDMVPNGTTCGDNKICLSNRCVDVSVFGRREDCAKKCNNNGVCNHKNECHCNPGWAPPHCDIRYADIPKASGQTVIIAGVCGGISTLLVISLVIAGLVCCKKGNMKHKYVYKRKTQSSPAKLNPMFQENGVRDRPQISQPILMESTSTRACSPLVVTVSPSRTPPQPPHKPSSVSCTSETRPMKPVPPPKPLSPLNKPKNLGTKPNPPPVPPVKPSPPPDARFKPPQPPAKPRVIRPV